MIMVTRILTVGPKHSWSLFRKKCLHCNEETRERVIHYFYYTVEKGRLKIWPAQNAEHYLCHSRTCIGPSCIKLREDIRKTAVKAAKEIAQTQLEQFAKVTGS